MSHYRHLSKAAGLNLLGLQSGRVLSQALTYTRDLWHCVQTCTWLVRTHSYTFGEKLLDFWKFGIS